MAMLWWQLEYKNVFNHSVKTVSTGKHDWKIEHQILKPKCILDRRNKMGAVNRTDMLLSIVQGSHKSVKWYNKLPLYIPEYQCSIHMHCNSSKINNMWFSDFRVSVIMRGLLEECKERRLIQEWNVLKWRNSSMFLAVFAESVQWGRAICVRFFCHKP